MAEFKKDFEQIPADREAELCSVEKGLVCKNTRGELALLKQDAGCENKQKFNPRSLMARFNLKDKRRNLEALKSHLNNAEFRKSVASPELAQVSDGIRADFGMEGPVNFRQLKDLITISRNDGVLLLQELKNLGLEDKTKSGLAARNFIGDLANFSKTKGLDLLLKLREEAEGADMDIAVFRGIDLTSLRVLAEQKGLKTVQALQEKMKVEYPYSDLLKFAADCLDTKHNDVDVSAFNEAVGNIRQYPVSPEYLERTATELGYRPGLNDQYLLHHLEKQSVRLDKRKTLQQIEEWLEGRKTYNENPEETLQTEIDGLGALDSLNLYRINLIIQALKDGQTKAALKKSLLEDFRDASTEYGGLLSYDPVGQGVQFNLKKPKKN